MQMDAEMVQASPALAADLQNSPTKPQVSKYYYKKGTRSHTRNGKDDTNYDSRIQPRSPLSRQSLTYATPTYHTGAFYEIDHEKLPPKSPIHLKSIRVVKVSECTNLDVTVKFPSLLALRSFFSSCPASGTGPELDECFVMSSNHAARILRRRVAEEELEGEVHQDSFWLVKPRLYNFAASQQAQPRAASPPVESCLLTTLKCDGTGWGMRRRVRYIGRHPDDAPKEASVDGYDTEASIREEQRRPATREVTKSARNCKRKREAEESSMEKHRDEGKKNKKVQGHSKKSSKKEKKRTVESNDGDPRRGKDRWSAERYTAAERSLLDIMRSRGARFSAPVMRQDLRQEARKHIGDTGLLDHLLKHMAGRVPEGSTHRFRRRHNADGAMEYWLEPAELAEVRREAGVSDPYWMPPPGWKPGDDVSPVAGDLLVKRQVQELAEEVKCVKRHMEQLLDKDGNFDAERAYSSLKEKYKSVVKVNENLEKQVFSLKDMYENVVQMNGELMKEVLSIKDKYQYIVDKNDKLGEQITSLSSSFLSFKDQLPLPLNMERAHQVEVAPSDGSREAFPGTAMYMASGDQISQQADGAVVQGGPESSERTARKSSFRIYKPQGTFLWPSMASGMTISGGDSSSCPTAAGPGSGLPRSTSCPSSAGPGLPRSSRAPFEAAAASSGLDERVMLGALSTPPSASSTNAVAAKLQLPLPSPRSPLQPQQLFATTAAGFSTLPVMQPFSGMTLRHVDTSSAHCGASLLEGKRAMFDADAGGISVVGTELALATPSSC
ncbi:protein AMEIOTIC 1-like [Phragmites australis]|uniref:protein AMEIOTIC 1-like n=1 Tax=Phragmites australis TaxID=29695 RepID=UPI002D7831F4|nr:protein AMEIOTIC 1-like [Phragmites australis]